MGKIRNKVNIINMITEGQLNCLVEFVMGIIFKRLKRVEHDVIMKKPREHRRLHSGLKKLILFDKFVIDGGFIENLFMWSEGVLKERYGWLNKETDNALEDVMESIYELVK